LLKNNELKIISKRLKKIFEQVYNKIKNRKLTSKTLDNEVLNILKNQKFKFPENELEIEFSEPIDEIYKAKAGRTPYDLLCFGKINGKKFEIFINNKYGDMYSRTRNDITTYNNLLRLYLGISRQRLTSIITINEKLIYKRVCGEEIVSYAVFVVDNRNRGAKFFLLEEIKDYLYVNPRNTMLQIRYNPSLGDPINYYDFCLNLIDTIFNALEKSLNGIKTELIVLSGIRKEIIKIGYENE